MHQEHLILQCEKPEELLDLVDNAGSVLWALDPESMGDYASGTNHVLPTYGMLVHAVELDLNSFENDDYPDGFAKRTLATQGPIKGLVAAVKGQSIS